MHTHTAKPTSAFKRQVVFRLSADDWPLLERAAAEHGSIQAAILAGLRALAAKRASPDSSPDPRATTRRLRQEPLAGVSIGEPAEDPNEEIRAREAAVILGVKPSTVSGYIRAGRLPGRYDDTLGSSGWVTTRGALEAYRRRISR